MDALNAAISLLSTHWVCVLIICAVFYILYRGIAPYTHSAIVEAVGDLPGPKPWPFVGNYLDMISYKGQLHIQFNDYYKKYGRLFRTFLFNQKPSLVIGDLDMLREMYVKEFPSFHDRPSAIKLVKPFNSMLTAATGETWHRIRTTLTPTFSGHKMKVMVPLLTKSCDVLIKKLDDAEKNQKSIDIYKYFQGIQMEAILSAFFGIDSNAQMDDDDPAFVAARKALASSPYRRILILIFLSIPGSGFFVRFAFFQRILLGPFAAVISLAEKIIASKKQSGTEGTKDFLDMMLTNTNNPDIPEGKRLAEDEVIAQSTVFLLGGYETTSNPLAFVCHHLATEPGIQEKAQQEIDEIWSDPDQPLSYDMANSMTYLEMIINETLRLYPPGSIISRLTTKDCTIKGLHIKKGTSILVPVYSIHRDPEYYPDPDKFDPERFSPEAKQSRDPYAYEPFGHGPRNCIGMRFALFEMKMILARILKKFSFIVAPETKIPPEVNMKTLLGVSKDGLILRVKSRD